MRKTIILLSVLLHCVVSFAQNEYSIVSGGQGKNGEFLVRVTTVVKDIKTAQAELKRCAVHGVLFRGFMGENSGDPSQQPLVQDSGVEQTKAEFFNTFFTQKEHKEPSSGPVCLLPIPKAIIPDPRCPSHCPFPWVMPVERSTFQRLSAR